MNRVNVLVRFNQLLQYCCSFPHIQYGHPRSHLPSQRLENTFFFISSAFSPLSCNDNNYMTYNWLNSSFFNFQENANQENCRQYSSIIFIYIYIYTPVFKKVFIERDIWIDIYTSVPLHVRPCAFFTCYCPTCEKLGSTINFFVVGFFVPIWHVVLSFFFRKIHAPYDTNFSLRIVQLVKKLASTINSLLVRFFVPICQYKRECTNIVYNSLDLHSFEN